LLQPGLELWICLPLALASAQEPPAESPGEGAAPALFRLDAEGGFPDAPTSDAPALEVVAADMDLDGDPDLLVHRHHLVRLELYENREGRFHLANPRGADTSGLWDNPGIGELFADEEEMLPRIAATEGPGIFVWHDLARDGRWNVLLRGDGTTAPRLILEANRVIDEVEGIEAERLSRPSARRLEVRTPADTEPRHLRFRVDQVSTELRIALEASEGPPPPVLVGLDLCPAPPGELVLWKPDPHGVAWIHTRGSPEPDLFVCRGALRGSLRAPLAPKRDRFYEGRAGEEPRYAALPGLFPPNYDRSRQVECVDIDLDGVLEYYVGCRRSANRLWCWDAEAGAFADRAPALGVDLKQGEAFAWFPYDGDGRADLAFVRGRLLAVARMRDGQPPEIVEVAARSSTRSWRGSPQIFERARIQPLDFDGDGRMDLLLAETGETGSRRLFRRTDAGFDEVTATAGLDRALAFRDLVLLDADEDSRVDAVVVGDAPELLRNTGEGGFQSRPLPELAAFGPVQAATSCDADGDGHLDLVLVGRRPALARGLGSGANRSLAVIFPQEPGRTLGAEVTAVYSDGRLRLQRYGSHAGSRLSHSLLPLRFGIPEGVRLLALRVRWPGEAEERSVPVDEGQARLELRR